MEAERNEPTATTRRSRRMLLALLAALGLLAGGRCAQLAYRDLAVLTAAPATPVSQGIAVQHRADELSDQDLALLAMACPQAIETAPRELRAALSRVVPAYRLTAAHKPHQGATEGEWLVDPNAWYAAEDRPVAKEDSPRETEETPKSGLHAPQLELPDAAEPVTPESVMQTPQAAPVGESQSIEPQTGASPQAQADQEATATESQLPRIDPPTAQPPSVQLAPPPEVEPPTTIETLPAPVRVAPGSLPESATPAEPVAPQPTGPLFGMPQLLSTEPVPPTAPPAVSPPLAQPQLQSQPQPRRQALPPASHGATAAPVATPTPPAISPLSPHSTPAKPLTKAEQEQADKSHRELFAENCYPSARDCAKCHKQQYEEWSISSHAYAFVSPMFHKFEQKITDLSQGTVGYFCMRCHSPVSVAMNESRVTPLWEMAEVAREGVTCIACHRVNEMYAKTNGERRVVPGDIYAPIYGGIGGEGVAAAIADKAKYKVKTSPEGGAGQPIHTEGRFFSQLSQAEFCTSCHQVAVHPGIKLEVVWEQYRASPACKKGITCQHCHMGTIPGVPSPYEIGPIAEVGGKHVNENRQHANHTFYGPGYSIAHPGIFPFHKDGDRWKINDWLLFDWRAGWGTDEFEDALDEGRVQVCFPEVWNESDDRYDAREIINDNLERLKDKRELRRQVMEHGSKVAGPFFKKQPCRGKDLKFNYVVTNLNEGHNLPTASLGAQPQLWANVVLIGPDGRRLWETGYLDSFGDLADIHSEDVRNGRLQFDSQLFNLQTMFLITGATGADREFFLPVNIDIDQVPLLRPGALPISVLNHPPFIRMESRSIAPLGSKRVKYSVPGKLIQQPGRYRLSFRLRSRTEPMYFMRFCESTVDMQRSMMEGVLDIHPYSVDFEVK